MILENMKTGYKCLVKIGYFGRFHSLDNQANLLEKEWNGKKTISMYE
jgi:hypothetical protein